MGYTHYYSHSKVIEQDKWNKFLADVKKVAVTFNLCGLQSVDFIKGGDSVFGNKDSSIKIGDGGGEGEAPTFDSKEVCFNGVNDEAHETLYIKRDDTGSQFCKTARKPYDILCTATLVLYKHHFGNIVSIGSDGGQEGFQEGLELVNETLDSNIKLQDLYPDNEDD